MLELEFQNTEDQEEFSKRGKAFADKIPEHVKQGMADYNNSLPINPAFFQAPQNKAPGPRKTRGKKPKPSIVRSHTPPSPAPSTSNTLEIASLNPAQDALRSKLLAVKNSVPGASSKKLWEVDDEDVEALKKIIDEMEGGETVGNEVMNGMLEVMEKFRAFSGRVRWVLGGHG